MVRKLVGLLIALFGLAVAGFGAAILLHQYIPIWWQIALGVALLFAGWLICKYGRWMIH